jgi:hypothetical protein
MPKSKTDPAPAVANAAKGAPKLQLLIAMLERPAGADIPAMMAATGWQAHSVRGALAGALRKKGHRVINQKIDGQRIYRIADGQADA